jgi:hypothetical protein
MWHCTSCGATIAGGTVCAACGQPLDPAVAKIAQKVRRLRVLGDVSRRWTRRGMRWGFRVAIVLMPVFVLFYAASWLLGPPPDEGFAESFLELAAGMMGLVIGLPLLGAAVALFLATMIRPICIALFCSIERFEQEYGRTRP